MVGRKPKTTSQQISAGDPRKIGKRKLQERLEAEPKATRGLAGCPKHVKGRARLAWKFWAEELEAMEIDRRPDSMMLEGTCVMYARAVEADIAIQRDGITVQDSTINKAGEVVVLNSKPHPAIAISNTAWTQLRSFCSEFGLSPVSRTRLSLNPAEKVDDLAMLLSKPRQQRQGDSVQ